MSKRTGPPVHQNKTAWVPSRADKHNTLRALVASLPNDGVCRRCYDMIEWKKQYGKYKPLRQPAKCVRCSKKAVELNYHIICQACARARNVCAKCEVELPPPENNDDDFAMPSAEELAQMNERQRRNIQRKAERAQAEKRAKERAENEEKRQDGPSGFVLNHTLLSTEEASAVRTPEQNSAEAAKIAHAAKQQAERMAAAQKLLEEKEKAKALAAVLPSDPPPPQKEKQVLAAAAAAAAHAAHAGKPTVDAGVTQTPILASYANASDDAACEAVAAEMASDADDDEDDEDEEGEEGEEQLEEEEDDDDEDDVEEDNDDEDSLREQVSNLSHSPGAAVLALQGYPWLNAAAHFAVAEAGFDALVERLNESGGGAAAAADAMSDRVAAVFDKASSGKWPGGGTAERSGAACLAMLLELECYACVLPSSFEADASAAEKKARELLKTRGGSLMAEVN